MARAAMNWTVQDLSRAAHVAPATISRVEAALTARPSSLAAIRITLERAGIVFIRHRDGDGVRLSRAAECVRDLLELANVAAGKAKIDTAIQERLDRFLAMATALQKEWRIEGGVYVSQLKQRIRIASRAVEPDIRETLDQALSYIRKTTRPPRYGSQRGHRSAAHPSSMSRTAEREARGEGADPNIQAAQRAGAALGAALARGHV